MKAAETKPHLSVGYVPICESLRYNIYLRIRIPKVLHLVVQCSLFFQVIDILASALVIWPAINHICRL